MYNTNGKDILDKTIRDTHFYCKGFKALENKLPGPWHITDFVLLHKRENLGRVPVFAFIHPCPPAN